ncbi:hypothetical protein D3C87_1616590 [compost metagenome]
MGHLQRTVGLLVGGLGQFLGFGAGIGNGLVGLLAGRQYRVESVNRRTWQTRLHIDPCHFDAQALPCCCEFGQPLIDALHQITAQALASFRRLAIGTDQFRTSDQNGVQIPCGRERQRAAGHQPIQSRQHMFALKRKRIGLGDLVENPNIELHHAGVTR